MGLLHSIRGAVNDRSLIRVATEAQTDSSMLAGCFNTLLTTALNMRDDGYITHFAMCHSDILAEHGWLDMLWGEMWHHRALVVSAVSPIKTLARRTSTAIGDANDRWKIKRCLTLKELASLPPTFGPEHVCGPDEVLLTNTGLWLADLRHPFWDTFAFQVHTRIRREENGKFVADQRTEDWELAYDLYDAGLRYVVNRTVKLRHEGGHKFPNWLEEPAA
jgi:hypothetical protein